MATSVCYSFLSLLILAASAVVFFSNTCNSTVQENHGNCFDGNQNIVSFEAITEEHVLEMKIPTGHKHKSGARSKTAGFRVEMVRRDSVQFEAGTELISKTERLRQAIERSKSRERMFLLKTTPPAARSAEMIRDVETPVHAGNGEFLMQIGIGSPALTYNAIVDTGSDLIWTQCQPCSSCYQQPGQIYNPSKSRTFSKAPCDSTFCQALPESDCNTDCEYQYQYGDSSFTTGVLAFETFTLETATTRLTKSLPLPRLAFGCGHDNEGGGFTQGGGLVGMGRGPLSLISQLGDKVSNKFSYCLVSIDDPASKTSPLLFGNTADLHGPGIKSTPLVQSSVQPTFYYLQLQGISVHGSKLAIPEGTFDLNSDGSGGIIIDSGTTITYLENPAYGTLKRAVQQSMKLQQADGSAIGLDLCYKMPSDTSKIMVPAITFHFAGRADYDLAAENAFIADEESGLICLAMGESSGLSIFGNVQQQNFHILYDLGMNKLSFVHAQCDAL